MSREINQEAHFSAPPHEASFAGRHLSAEALANPERERAFATHDPHAVSTARLATSGTRIVPLRVKAEDGGGLGSWLTAAVSFLVLRIIIPAAIGAGIGYIAGSIFSGGNPLAAAIVGAIGGIVSALIGFSSRR